MDGNIRKLASIRRIDDIKPHDNANSLELAIIGGWQVVVKLGQFKPDDLCVYCEIDCLMPEKPEFEFLRSNHFRIKTQKIRGKLSQGIAFPISILGIVDNDIIYFNGETRNISQMIGEDVSEYLGITKYEPPISPQLMGMVRGNFPSHIIPKTDEERGQNCLKVFEEMKGKTCYITLKEDGTSFTAYHIVEQDITPEVMSLVQRVGVCSRNLELKNESFPGADLNIYWKIAKQYDIEDKLIKFYHDTGRSIAIQGEITGDGIQRNRLGLPRNTNQLHLFNIYDIDNHKYLDYAEFIMVASVLEIPTVETIYFGVFDFTLEQLLEMAKGKYNGTENNREGIVIRLVEEAFSETLQGRMSFKVINNEFLLKEEE
jgi:RNA ligase (TIGR02306 family)